jgi:surfeit locus 1 family protein
VRARAIRALVVPAIFTALGVAILAGLGVWQIERKAWKEDLIARLTERLMAAPHALPARQEWPGLDATDDEFRRVSLTAEFLSGQDALVYTGGSTLRSDVSGQGYWVFTPARVGNGIVAVNRGFVPQGQQKAINAAVGSVTITGYLRWPETRGWFAAQDDPDHNLWFVRDPAAIAAAKSWGPIAPFYIDMEGPVPSAGLPRPGPLTVKLPNNHLGYAITWFGLAASLVVVFLAFAWKRLRTS